MLLGAVLGSGSGVMFPWVCFWGLGFGGFIFFGAGLGVSCFPGAGFVGLFLCVLLGSVFCGLMDFGSVLELVFGSVVSWGLFFGGLFLRVILGSVFVGQFWGSVSGV